MLIAFQLKGGGTEIADAHILNSGAGNASSTEGLTITGVGLVKLVGVNLSQVEGSVIGSNDVVHFST